MKADALFESGDLDGARTWRLIVQRIDQLRNSGQARLQ
jgi:hypothetical protein